MTSGPSINESPPQLRVALMSMHTSPTAELGGRETGGMNVYVLETARRLAGLGIAVDVFVRRDNSSVPDIEQVDSFFRVIHIVAGPVERVEKEDMSPLIEVFAESVCHWTAEQNLNFDVVHSHYWLSIAAGVIVSKHWDIPHVGMFHTFGEIKILHGISANESIDRLKTESEVVSVLDRVIIASRHEGMLLKELYGVDDSRLEIIPPGVDLKRFSPRNHLEAKSELNLPMDRLILLAGGRFERLKGLDILLEALAKIDEPRERWQLYLFGGNSHPDSLEERERLFNLSKSLGIEENVIFMGSISHEILPSYYQASDLVIVPSLYESFGMVALEALASAKPLIASDVGGLPGMLGKSTNPDQLPGILIPPSDVIRLSEAISSVMNGPHMAEKLSLLARQRAMEYSWDLIAEDLSRLYRILR